MNLKNQTDSPCERLVKLALECGFTNACAVDPAKINVYRRVRETCADGKCKNYAKNWACPPACGTLEDCADRIHGYKSGVIMQTTGGISGNDMDSMLRIGVKHSEHISAFSAVALAEYPYSLVLGWGSCRICETCTYPFASCRSPKKMISSMEAYGMIVGEVCTGHGIPYDYGKGTLTFVACFLTS
jgi:predicted metal-binding protein